MGYSDHKQYVELTMHFRCNLACEHCMIGDTMRRFEPESMQRFQDILEYNRRHRCWKGIVFTGAEITLRRDLPDLARRAREHAFEHIRIQTHGMQLADPHYCRELVNAGIDEYFVSVAAADAATHDAITAASGSFEKTLQGLQNLDEHKNIVTFSNTVITSRSFRRLPDVVDRLKDLTRLVQMDFWNYWPMNETDEKDLVVPFREIRPFLMKAIQKAVNYGRHVEVRNYPECLMGEYRSVLVNDQPTLIIDSSFWAEFQRNGFHQCVHRERCRALQCLGVNTAYLNRYGDESDLLTPLSPQRTPTPGDHQSDCDSGDTQPIDTTILEPRTDRAQETSELFLKWVRDRTIPFGLEHSFRITDATLRTNRFLVTMDKHKVKRRPNQAFIDLCCRLNMPALQMEQVRRNLSLARFVHFGYEEQDHSRLLKIYLEFPRRPILDRGLLQHLAFKWNPEDPDLQVATQYILVPNLSAHDMINRISSMFPDATCLDIARSILGIAVQHVSAQEIQYLEVVEEDKPRNSFDLNLYNAQLRVGDFDDELMRMPQALGVSSASVRALLDQIGDLTFGHLAGGIHRNGKPFFNVYYGAKRNLGVDSTYISPRAVHLTTSFPVQ